MANAGGFIYESIWRNPEFQALSGGAQRLYVQLLTQKELDCAGVLPLHVEKWAKACKHVNVEQLWADLDELQSSRFVFYDTDTDEACVRTYIRNSNVMKVPNMRKSARRAATLVASPLIRLIVAQELRSTGDSECIATADEINPSERVTEPLANRSKSNPSETLPEGSGMGKGKGVTHLGNNSGGVSRPICAKHPNGNPNDDNCRGCMKARQWDESLEHRSEADQLEERRLLKELRDNCPVCDENGLIETPFGMSRCDHQMAAHA